MQMVVCVCMLIVHADCAYCCRTLNTLVIQRALLKEVPVQEMLSSQTIEVSFALRVKIFQYPEHVFSVWLMLAMKCPGPKRFSRSSQ